MYEHTLVSMVTLLGMFKWAMVLFTVGHIMVCSVIPGKKKERIFTFFHSHQAVVFFFFEWLCRNRQLNEWNYLQ